MAPRYKTVFLVALSRGVLLTICGNRNSLMWKCQILVNISRHQLIIFIKITPSQTNLVWTLGHRCLFKGIVVESLFIATVSLSLRNSQNQPFFVYLFLISVIESVGVIEILRI